MDIMSILADFIQKDGVAVALIFFGAWFLTTKIWPFLTKEYWPSASRRAENQVSTMKELTGAVLALEMLCSQMVKMLQEQTRMIEQIQLTELWDYRDRKAATQSDTAVAVTHDEHVITMEPKK